MSILIEFTMNKLAIIGIAVAALVLATAVIAITPSAFARDVQIGRCRNCQQAQNSGDDSLNTNGGIFQNREGGG
jgi:hypothetical protein